MRQGREGILRFGAGLACARHGRADGGKHVARGLAFNCRALGGRGQAQIGAGGGGHVHTGSAGCAAHKIHFSAGAGGIARDGLQPGLEFFHVGGHLHGLTEGKSPGQRRAHAASGLAGLVELL